MWNIKIQKYKIVKLKNIKILKYEKDIYKILFVDFQIELLAKDEKQEPNESSVICRSKAKLYSAQ